MNDAPKYPVKTLDKAIEILNILYKSADLRGLGITEISNLAGLNKSVVHRILDTLLYNGFIDKDPDTCRYRLGWGLYTIAQKVPQQNHLYSLSLNYLIELGKVLNATVNLGILRETESIIISKIEPNARDSVMRIGTQIGVPEPAYATSLGKLLLSDKDDDEIRQLFGEKTRFNQFTVNTAANVEQLIERIDETRKCGYALDNEELVIGLTCISMPVRDYTGRIAAGISVSMPSALFNSGNKELLMEKLRKCCSDVSRALGYAESV